MTLVEIVAPCWLFTSLLSCQANSLVLHPLPTDATTMLV